MRLRTWLGAGTISWAVALGTAALAADCTECHGEPRFGRSLRASAHAELACAACHVDLAGDPHRRSPTATADPRAVAAASCVRCHEKAATEYAASAHASVAGKGVAPTCASCHGEAHAVARAPKIAEGNGAARMAAFNRELGLCGRCHADAKLTEKMGLNAAVVKTYETSMHGSRARLGHGDSATCTDCHGRHDVRDPADPASALHPSRRADLCARCHPGADAAFVATFEHQVTTRDGFAIGYWVKKLYTWLVVLVSGGLALHVFLDVQAEVRARVLGHRRLGHG